MCDKRVSFSSCACNKFEELRILCLCLNNRYSALPSIKIDTHKSWVAPFIARCPPILLYTSTTALPRGKQSMRSRVPFPIGTIWKGTNSFKTRIWICPWSSWILFQHLLSQPWKLHQLSTNTEQSRSLKPLAVVLLSHDWIEYTWTSGP